MNLVYQNPIYFSRYGPNHRRNCEAIPLSVSDKKKIILKVNKQKQEYPLLTTTFPRTEN